MLYLSHKNTSCCLMLQLHAVPPSSLAFSLEMPMAYPPSLPSQSGLIPTDFPGMDSHSDIIRRTINSQLTPMTAGFKESAQVHLYLDFYLMITLLLVYFKKINKFRNSSSTWCQKCQYERFMQIRSKSVHCVKILIKQRHRVSRNPLCKTCRIIVDLNFRAIFLSLNQNTGDILTLNCNGNFPKIFCLN